MVKTIEAIYTGGVLKPLEALPFEEQQRVRITVEQVDNGCKPDRGQALERLVNRLGASTLHLDGPIPTREELHQRGGSD